MPHFGALLRDAVEHKISEGIMADKVLGSERSDIHDMLYEVEGETHGYE